MSAKLPKVILGSRSVSTSRKNPADLEYLGGFRYAVARVVRFLIRARLQSDPNFLSEKECKAWFPTMGKERHLPKTLLELALTGVKNSVGSYMEFCQSGGYSCDPNWENEGDIGHVKELIASFVDPVDDLPNAIRQAEMKHRINWENVAQWHELPKLRQALDKLPVPPSAMQRNKHHDGPHEDGTVWWKGNHQELQPIPHKLCDFMWNRDNASFEKIAAHVWDDVGEIGEQAIKSAVCRVNRCLFKLDVPWSISIHQRQVTRK